MSVERQEVVMKILDDQNHLSERADTKAISLLSTLGIFTVFFVTQLSNMTLNELLYSSCGYLFYLCSFGYSRDNYGY